MLQASSWAIARTDDKAWVSKKEDKELPCWHRKFKKKKKPDTTTFLWKAKHSCIENSREKNPKHYSLALEGKA